MSSPTNNTGFDALLGLLTNNTGSDAMIDLLDDPSVLLIASNSGTPLAYAQKISAANGLVSADRSRQMIEEAESNHRPYEIEMPARALAVASKTFQQGYEQSSIHSLAGVSQLPFDMGKVLPSYAMCVLDWLVRALRSKQPIVSVPEEPEIAGKDKWYWLYSYEVMRSLGMDYAEELRPFIERLINREGLIDDCES
ncbi:hypothetical protein EJ02DRAFT_119439 [Clathrospora elynae]|uniref:Uncharacterized protein n=1 Tax=Clathrospora elynae TaxID=706981 RepID=A0A6A5SE05_9PLEO|nr:hypothetical protein EJ02DRAFT_119439 [Clathrospora elynae]